MKQYHKNPRQITGKQYGDLEKWLRELGDLSGIVHDLNSDEIIGGNQRSRVFDVNKCKVELSGEPHEPDEQGTVAHGFIVWEGKRYAYRQVRWTEKQCEQANIVANKAGGNWDFDILANDWDVPDLVEWGFKPYELGIPGEIINPDDEWKDMPEFENEEAMGDYHTIKVHFMTPEAMQEFSDLVAQQVNDKTKYIWYPKQERLDLKQYRATDES